MLSISDVVDINIFVNQASTSSGVFDVGLILGSSTVIASTTRCRAFSSLADMLTAGFTADSPEYLAAQAYFGVNPAPTSVLVGAIAEGETPVQALTACIETNPDFDAVVVCGLTDEQAVAVDAYLRNIDRYHLFYSASGVVATAVSGIFTTMKNAKTRRAIGIYSSETYAAAALAGMVMGLIHANPETAVQSCYRPINGLEIEDLTAAEVSSLKGVNANVYIARRNRNLFENGATGDGMRIEDSIYLDMLASRLQDALFEVMTASARRLPQTDATSARFLNACINVLDNFLAMGVIAGGEWKGLQIGNVTAGDALEKGYVLSVEPFATQSAEDRAAHKAMPITIGVMFAGSVETVVVNVNAQL